jgi:alpha-N-arabinofuranosidase
MQGSASLLNKNLVLTVVNPHVSETRETEISVRGASIGSAAMTILTHSDLHAHNSFARRDEVTPQTKTLAASGKTITLSVPPACVMKLALTLI